MERKWEVLPDARDCEIQRLREAVQERDGVIERVLLRELRLQEAITEANEAMRDGSDSTAWAILVAALARKEPRD